jgi:hypothetical protein
MTLFKLRQHTYNSQFGHTQVFTALKVVYVESKQQHLCQVTNICSRQARDFTGVVDPYSHNFGGFGSGSYPFQTKCKDKLYFFPENFNVLYGTVENVENFNTYYVNEKDKTM